LLKGFCKVFGIWHVNINAAFTKMGSSPYWLLLLFNSWLCNGKLGF